MGDPTLLFAAGMRGSGWQPRVDFLASGVARKFQMARRGTDDNGRANLKRIEKRGESQPFRVSRTHIGKREKALPIIKSFRLSRPLEASVNGPYVSV